MKAFKKALAVLLTLAMVFTTMATFDVTTDAKIKSIKVAKKVTVTVGKTATVKVKVKATGKTSKKFTVKASKKKIVKTKIKKGKLQIKGLKAGTVKLTVKAKANKKVKKTIKVTVKQADVTMNVRQVYRDVFCLDFSRAVKVDPAKIAIQIKGMQSGKYEQSCSIEDVSTSDSKMYTVDLENNLNYRDGNFMKFTVSGVNKKPIVKEIETYCKSKERLSSEVHTITTTTDIDEHWDAEDIVDSGYGKYKSVTGVPTGLTLTNKDGRIRLKGRITKEGTYTTTAQIEDEKGTIYTLRIIFVVGSASKIQIYCPKQTVGIYENDKYSYGSLSIIYIAGGCGSYTVTSQDDAGIFVGDPSEEDSYRYFWTFQTKTIGTKTGKFLVTDHDNTSLTAVGTAVVETKKTILVKGKVLTKSGKPIKKATVRAALVGTTDGYFPNYGYADDKGEYEMQVFPGTYDIAADTFNMYSYIFGKKITGNITQNITIGVYEVKMKSNNSLLNSKFFKDWETKLDSIDVGYGDTLYLRPKTYELISSDYVFPGIDYDANATFTVKGDMTVTANVSAQGATITDIYLGSTNVEATEDKMFFRFVAPSTGTYEFNSTDCTGDPDLTIYDEDGDEIDNDETIGNFDLTENLTGGKIYFLEYEEYEGIGETSIFHIYSLS